MSKTGPLTKIDLLKMIAPITQITAYGNGCFVTHRKMIAPLQGKLPTRSNIKMLSRRSLIRLIFLMQCTPVKFRSMLTLTYPYYFPRDGEVVKSDLAAVTQKIRRLEYEYLWFLEFQKRGAPHVHILLTPDSISPHLRVDFGLYWTQRIATSKWFLTVCPVDSYDTEVLKMAKFNVNPKIIELIKHPEGARNYVSKYASKERQKKVPPEYENVGRFWGCSRSVMPGGTTLDVTEEELEDWLKEKGHPAGRYDLIPKYLWGLQQES